MTLDIVLPQGPRGRLFLMSEVPLHSVGVHGIRTRPSHLLNHIY